MQPREKIRCTIGIYIAILDPTKDGGLLIWRRTEEGSIIPGVSFYGNWEMPGGGVYIPSGQVRYDYPLQEGLRQLEEEVGIKGLDKGLEVSGMPMAGMLLFQTDLALVVPWSGSVSAEPTKGETRWVSPREYNELARDFVGPKEAREQGLPGARGLVSGWGKRMHCLGLRALTCSPNEGFAKEAWDTLAPIIATW